MTARLASGREALTDYRVLRRFEKFTLLEVRIGTGRTHQIRVHLTSIGHPWRGIACMVPRRFVRDCFCTREGSVSSALPVANESSWRLLCRWNSKNGSARLSARVLPPQEKVHCPR
jgi:hypothetical protein